MMRLLKPINGGRFCWFNKSNLDYTGVRGAPNLITRQLLRLLSENLPAITLSICPRHVLVRHSVRHSPSPATPRHSIPSHTWNSYHRHSGHRHCSRLGPAQLTSNKLHPYQAYRTAFCPHARAWTGQYCRTHGNNCLGRWRARCRQSNTSCVSRSFPRRSVVCAHGQPVGMTVK